MAATFGHILMSTVDAYFLQYQKCDTIQKRATIYDILSSMESAKRTQDVGRYDYFLKLSQTINNWHLAHLHRGVPVVL